MTDVTVSPKTKRSARAQSIRWWLALPFWLPAIMLLTIAELISGTSPLW